MGGGGRWGGRGECKGGGQRVEGSGDGEGQPGARGADDGLAERLPRRLTAGAEISEGGAIASSGIVEELWATAIATDVGGEKETNASGGGKSRGRVTWRVVNFVSATRRLMSSISTAEGWCLISLAFSGILSVRLRKSILRLALSSSALYLLVARPSQGRGKAVGRQEQREPRRVGDGTGNGDCRGRGSSRKRR